MNWELELIAVLAQGLFLSRWYFQLKASKKAGRSVTPIIFWVIHISANVLMAIYTFMLGSLILPITSIASIVLHIFVSQYNIKLELKHKDGGKK